jgi:hypothetical protein
VGPDGQAEATKEDEKTEVEVKEKSAAKANPSSYLSKAY